MIRPCLCLAVLLSLIQLSIQKCNPVYQYECPKSKECIGKAWVCDNDPDCPDSEDEEPFINCADLKCKENQFKCRHGQCISESWVCDGVNDCPVYKDDEDPRMCAERRQRKRHTFRSN